MSKQQDDDVLLQQVNQQLDDKEQALSADVLSRLRQSRQRALDQLNADHSDRKRLSGWRPMGAVAMVMSVFVIMIGLQFIQTDSVSHPDALSDLPLLTATEELELYEELEFYQWLEFEDRTG